MAEPIFDALGAVLTRWTMGSAAAPAASMWKDALGSEAEEAELRLLALSGQFLGAAVTAEPPADLRTLPDVPALAIPTVPEKVRPLLRRTLMAVKDARAQTEIIHFVAVRGWAVHPADWMPAANYENVPDIYAPWCDWVEAATSTAEPARETSEEITSETWTDWGPAGRNYALAQLRRRDPQAARLLLEAKLAGETADRRLRLLEVFSVALSEADASFLESVVASDRAPKVKALAAVLLARLSRGGAASVEELAELKGFFSVKVKGLLRRSREVDFENIKTTAQEKRLGALLENIDVTSFARTLGLTDMDLVAGWPWLTNNTLDYDFSRLIERTGTDKLVGHAAEIVSRQASGQMLLNLSPRLAPAQREAHAAVSLSVGNSGLNMARAIAGGVARLKDPLSTPAGSALLADIGGQDPRPADTALALHALGLITARAWARRVLERLNAAGIVLGDPRLDMLRLNEALEDRGEKP